MEYFSVESNIPWLNMITRPIQKIFLEQLLWKNCFNEIHITYKRKFFKRKPVKTEYAGIWGWNSWCGIHTLPLLGGNEFRKILKNTIEVGFQNIDEATGLFPHAVIHGNGIFASQVERMCYGGKNGEGFNLDNMICWVKMAMEYYLFTCEDEWFTQTKMQQVTRFLDFILKNHRSKYNSKLIWAGIEGCWTECTDWELDNTNVNVNFLRALQLAIECQYKFGKTFTELDYPAIYNEMTIEFNKPYIEGGFWYPELGFFIHGNNGQGTLIHGDKYFESTANYFALLWGISSPDHQQKQWNYINMNRYKIESPYPVLTNYRPRTGARRKAYGKTVTNGDIWMVLGAHAAASRLQAGFIKEGTQMFKAIVDYEREEGVLHNCIYQDGKVNDSWDPEIANYGSFYAVFVLGILGIKPKSDGVEFHLRPLAGLEILRTNIYLFGKNLTLKCKWDEKGIMNCQVNDLKVDTPDFLIENGEPIKIRVL